MNLTKGFSVIIPCYNPDSYLIEAVESIVRQDFKYPFEIIVINDASNTKETHDALTKISSYKNIKIINFLENRGAQAARNAGIQESQFNYILCLDADDKLNTENSVLQDGTYIDTAIDILEDDNEIAFVHTSYLMFGNFDGLTISAYPITEELVLKKHHVQTSIVYRRNDAMLAGMYDEEIKKWQDWSFAVSLLNNRLKRGLQNKIYYIDKPCYLYRIHHNPNRISLKDISEESMIEVTVKKNPEIFHKYYGVLPSEIISKKVLENKPSKLVDIFYIASYNLNRALQMIQERGLRLIGDKEPNNIP